jgi:hypothetical protein
MEQRPLRLGDLVDDYCPRERRVTDHAVVAMIDDAIKQTRCTACDAEHPYKGGKAPRRRKAPVTARLYKEVLAGLKEADPETDADSGEPASGADDASVADLPVPALSAVYMGDVQEVPGELSDLPNDEAPMAIAISTEDIPVIDEPPDEGPVHRPLIRATLPRPDGVKAERPIPDFTIRHNGNGRPQGNGNFRDARGGGKGRSNGQQRFNRGPGGARHGHGGGSGFGGGRPDRGGSRRRGR